MWTKFAVFVLCFVNYSYAQKQEAANCPLNWLSLKLVKNFDFNRFMGRWYELYYYDPGEPRNSPLKWDNLDFNFHQEGTSYEAKADLRATDMAEQRCFTRSASGYMRLEADSSNQAKMKFIQSSNGQRDTHMWVVATDYITYAVVIQCPFNNLEQGKCSSGTKINVLARQKILINEFDVRKIVTEQLCRDYDNGLYEVYHNQDCVYGNAGTILVNFYNTIFLIPLTVLFAYFGQT